jgi:hypothetical protein
VKELCQNFAGVESKRYYQGDGMISNVDELLGDVPSHATTDGANKSACQLYEFHLYTLKAQKDLGLYKLSESNWAKEAARSALMGDINRVTQDLFVLLCFCFITITLANYFHLFTSFYRFTSNNKSITTVTTTAATSANSSVTALDMDFKLSAMTPKSQSSSTNTVLGRTKRKSPTNAYPISCLRCFADNNEFIRADFEAKTVICMKCSHVAVAEDYSNEDFVRAYLYNKKESGSGGGTVKRHLETAYYSIIVDSNRTTNECAMIALQDAENQRAASLEDQRMQHQEKLFELQAKLLDRVLPKKSSVEVYRENKAAVTQMLAAREIDQEEAEDLYNKLKANFLSSKTI